jgi:penicillin-insensitive murein endopeptidase
MPDRRLTPKEREELSATSMLTPDSLAVNPQVWTPAHVQIVKRAASYREVERVFVHPAIKKALCETASGDRRWLSKVRPIWGHYYHFHVRMDCPAGSATCETQAPPPADDGCGKELTDWYALLTKPAPPPAPAPPPVIAAPAKPAAKPPLTMAELPNECRVVLDAGTAKATADTAPASQPSAATAAGKPQSASRSAQQ